MTIGASAVRCRNVSKRFARSLKRAMVFGLIDIARSALLPERYRSDALSARVKDGQGGAGPEEAPLPPLRESEFWALRNVSFDIHRGECMGFIGHNGAGKSTLFKVLGGIFGPTTGRVEIEGRVSALIEVGSGFHPMLTGRENIFLSAAILGLSNAQIARKFDEIVAFSGVEEFLDMPIKFYSSGMHVRLGFAVMAHLDPEVMLIDEILAVGDMEFQEKCIRRITAMRESGMAMALVSHSLYRVESLCDRVLWLDRGAVLAQGACREIVKQYRDSQLEKIRRQDGEPAMRDGLLQQSAYFEISGFQILDAGRRPVSELEIGQPFGFRMTYKAKRRIEKPFFNFDFVAGSAHVFDASMLIDGETPDFVEGPGILECWFDAPNLLPRAYQITLWIRSSDAVVELIEPFVVGRFSVLSKGSERLRSRGVHAHGLLTEGGLTFQSYRWEHPAT